FTFDLSVIAVDVFEDRFAWSERRFDGAVKNEPQLLDGFDTHRVADDHRQRIAFAGERQNDVFAGDRLGDEFDYVIWDRYLGEIDVIEAMVFGHGSHYFFARGVAEPNEAIGNRQFRLLACHLFRFG